MSGQHRCPRHIFHLPMALALCMALTAAQATPAAPADTIHTGDWRGTLSASDVAGPVYVRLSGRATGVDSPQTGDVRFGPPFNCALELRDQADGYMLLSCNSGKCCDALAGGRAQIQVTDGSAAGIQLTLQGLEAPMVIAFNQGSVGLIEAGRWRGAGLISAQLEIVSAAVRPGDIIGRLRYGAPRDCQVELRYAGRNAGALTAWIGANDRGYCRRLSDSQASMQIGPDGSAVLSLLLNGQRDIASFERVPAG
ncbi:hypothetical protein [Xanthomonas arboricola]|uniref:hypothetical protein n=1 Tax=Xanthomonas arboricola TaxID=56448 RepID=UPI000F8D7E40|nr:hypothetical protein [Xanthomonas arboricola]